MNHNVIYYKRNLIFSIVSLLIGLSILSVAIILNSIHFPIIVYSALDIFAWVFIWESVEVFFFHRAELRHQQLRQMNFINANIILK